MEWGRACNPCKTELQLQVLWWRCFASAWDIHNRSWVCLVYSLQLSSLSQVHSFPLCAQSSSYSGYVRGPHFPDARCAGEGCSASPNDKETTGIRFGSGYGAAWTVVELYTTFFLTWCTTCREIWLHAYTGTPTYAEWGSSWKKVTLDKIARLKGHLVYRGIIHITGIRLYLNTWRFLSQENNVYWVKCTSSLVPYKNPSNASLHGTSNEVAPRFQFLFLCD